MFSCLSLPTDFNNNVTQLKIAVQISRNIHTKSATKLSNKLDMELEQSSMDNFLSIFVNAH